MIFNVEKFSIKMVDLRTIYEYLFATDSDFCLADQAFHKNVTYYSRTV